MEQKGVVVIGELNVDIILNHIDGFPAVGKEILAGDLTLTLGSSSAIFAGNLASLGVPVIFIGKVGRDQFAELVLSSLRERKVDTTGIVTSGEVNTGATVVLNYGQDRANVTYPGAMNYLTAADIDFSLLEQAGHLHFSSYFLQPGIKKDLPGIFKRAKQMGLTTSLDPQWDPSEEWDFPLKELLPWVDVFLPNEGELMSISGSATVDEGIAKLKVAARHIVVKNGTEGAVGWDGERIIRQPAFMNTEVVDCIGAGDSFNAGFIYEYTRQKSLPDCMRTGALTGAINTTRAGGTGAFESLELVRSIAKTCFNMAI